MVTYILCILFAIALTNIILKVDKTGTIWQTKFFRIRYIVAWYDLWAGIFIKGESTSRPWYIMLPTFGIIFTWYKQHPPFVVVVISEFEEVIILRRKTYYKSFHLTQLSPNFDSYWWKSNAIKRGKELAHKLGYELDNQLAWDRDKEHIKP